MNEEFLKSLNEENEDKNSLNKNVNNLNNHVISLLNKIEIKKIADDKLLKDIKAVLKDFKPSVVHSYKISDEIAINELKIALNKVKIPERIILAKENHISFEKGTQKFLWWYFLVSIPIIVGVLVAFVYFEVIPEYKLYQKGYSKGDSSGQKNMAKYLIENMPKNSANWIKNNINEIFWK